MKPARKPIRNKDLKNAQPGQLISLSSHQFQINLNTQLKL
jgi:hypothetical protein